MFLSYDKKLSSFRKVLGLIITLFVVSLLALPRGLFAATPPAPSIPTLIWSQNQEHSFSGDPIIKGVTSNNTEVEVFIDGQLNGKATVKNGKQTTASFAYTPFLSLEPGKHTVSVQAIDENSNLKSKLSAARTLIIEEPYPAPTLFQPVVNDKTITTKPFIVGLALDGSLIKVFIDGKLNGQFRISGNKTEVMSFAYQPFLDLDPNQDHLVYTTATDDNGKESAYSNVVGFKVKASEVKITGENPQVLGVNDTQTAATESLNENQQAESVQEENAEGSEITSENEATNGEESQADQEDSENGHSTLIWWIIIIIVVVIVIINLRGRGGKDKLGGLKGLAELGKKEGDHSGQSSSESKSEQQTLLNKEESKDSYGGDKDMPPPPPSK